jgi:hypothetical protein
VLNDYEQEKLLQEEALHALRGALINAAKSVDYLL